MISFVNSFQEDACLVIARWVFSYVEKRERMVSLMALTPKQQRFVEEYLIDLNATQAATRAGYSDKTARKIGNENLTKPDIQGEIQKRMKDREKRTGVTQDKVLKELATIGFADVTDYVRIEAGQVKIKSTADIPKDKIGAIAGIKEGANGIEVKLNDKGKALELLGRHLGMFKDKMELSGDVSINNPFAGLTTEQLKKLIDDG